MMIYVASRTHHAPLWLRLRDEEHLPISSTWINEYKPATSPDISDLWTRCIQEASECSALVAYIGPGDLPVKGVFIEVGAALASRRPVFVAYDPNERAKIGSWISHPLVTECDGLSAAIESALRIETRPLPARR